MKPILKPTTREDVVAAMQEQGVSYSELARRTGLPKSNLQRYLTTAKSVRDDRWAAILDAMGLPAGEPLAPPIILRTPHAVPAKPVNLIGVVRISEEAERELHRLAAETGLSLKAVASELIIQAAKICTIERR